MMSVHFDGTYNENWISLTEKLSVFRDANFWIHVRVYEF